MMSWFCLGGAIVFEVFATTMMKVADGFSRLWPSLAVVVGYIAAFGLMALALKTMQVGTLYALWAGIGTALIAVVGMVVFREPITATRVAGIVLVIGGVVLLNLSGVH